MFTSSTFDAPIKGGGASRQNIPMLFGMEETRMVWLPDGENSFKICSFV